MSLKKFVFPYAAREAMPMCLLIELDVERDLMNGRIDLNLIQALELSDSRYLVS
jgi:hypothetical protein